MKRNFTLNSCTFRSQFVQENHSNSFLLQLYKFISLEIIIILILLNKYNLLTLNSLFILVLYIEYTYNTSFYATKEKTPFEVVYGRPPPTLISYIPGTASVDSVEQELKHMIE
jgi:hypothetical protein